MAYTSSFRLELKVRAPQNGDKTSPGSDPGAIDLSMYLNSTDITKVHHKTYNIAASSSQSLDLVSALLDVGGNAITFTKVKAIVVVNRSTSATRASKIGWTSNGVPFISAAATTPLKPVYVFVNSDGTTVTAGTGDIVLVYNDDPNAAADIEVLICGS